MKHVLLIDDSIIVLEAVRIFLEGAGYKVTAISDPSFFDPKKEAAPDLILLDVNMPEFFGDDVARFYREVWDVKVPIYLFSTMSEEELEQRAADCGADGYIPKDGGLDNLRTRVNQILGSL